MDANLAWKQNLIICLTRLAGHCPPPVPKEAAGRVSGLTGRLALTTAVSVLSIVPVVVSAQLIDRLSHFVPSLCGVRAIWGWYC